MFMDFPVNGLSGSYKTCNPKRLLGCTDASSALEPALSGICGFEVSGVEEADGSASRARFLRNIIMYWFGLSNWEHTIRVESFYASQNQSRTPTINRRCNDRAKNPYCFNIHLIQTSYWTTGPARTSRNHECYYSQRRFRPWIRWLSDGNVDSLPLKYILAD